MESEEETLELVEIASSMPLIWQSLKEERRNYSFERNKETNVREGKELSR